jgi:Ca2+-binding RTX toxin-like protein
MAPSWMADQTNAAPAGAGMAAARDLPRRRTAASPLPAGARARRPNLDSLAIGAPLTAAFIGVLLAEAGAVASDPAGTADGVSAVGGSQAGDLGASSGRAAQLPPAPDAGGGATTGATSGQQAALDPVSVGAPPPEAATAAGIAAGAELPSPAASEVSAGVSAKAGAAGGSSVNMTMLGLDDGASGGDTPQPGEDGSTGTIGDHVTGSDGDDVIHGTPGDDHIAGGAGDDVIYGHDGDDTLLGETGNDQLFGGAGDDLLDGGSGHDELHGGSGDDDLLGGTGNDQLFGGTGQDQLDGGPGQDLLDGGAGADQMQGGTGNDVLIVDDLHDVALDNTPGPNGGGSDTLQVDDGFAATLEAAGGPASVTFVFSDNLGITLPADAASYSQQVAPGIEHVVLSGSAHHDVLGNSSDNQITGNGGDNALYGWGGDDVLRGAAGNDLLDGGAGRDRLEGDAGDDVLNGGSAADELYGGAGDDILNGGLGSDQLYGGVGNDTFVIGLNDSAVDTVFDHNGVNQLRLDGFEGGAVQTTLVGDDLYLAVDHSVVAVVSDYRGHEDAWSGIDLGQGAVPFADLMAATSATPASASSATSAALAPAAQGDLLGAYLSQPSLSGGAGADHLVGSSGADWLSGLAGDDHLQGGAGNDVLDGGPGADLLEGGAGDDRYLFKSGEWGLDTIRDAAGSNVVELDGLAGARLEGRVVGNDLYVVADHAPLFKVENHVGHEEAFAGVEVDGELVTTDDLLA